MVEKGVDIAPANGKLGILLVGLGALNSLLSHILNILRW